MAVSDSIAKRESILGGGVLLALLSCLLVGTSLGLQWGRTATERDRTWPSESYDEVYFHRPVIETFAEQLPTPSLADYDSATTPGYHLLGAVLLRAGDLGLVRLFFAGCALLLPLLLYRAAAPRLGIGWGLLLASLLCLSNYVIAAATWITTDNVALLFVALALIGMLTALDRDDWRWLVLASLAVAAALLVRQIHLWLCGPLFVSALLFWSRDLRGFLAGCAGCLIAMIVVGGFVLLWGGLTPPGFAAQHAGGWNFAALAYILALVGGLSLFFTGFLSPTRDDWVTLVLGACIGLLAAAVLTTAPDPDAGRWGGVIWQLAARLPIFGGRSLAFLFLCPLGGAALLLWLKRTWTNGGGLVVLAILAFAAAHTANFQVWQRYYEPFLLVALILLASRSDTKERWAPWPVAILAIGLAALAAVKIYLPLSR